MRNGLIALFLVVLAVGPIVAAENATESDILAVLEEQAAAWNRGDIPAFMEGYKNTDTLRFASGGSVTYGWQETLDRYLKGYNSPALMGHLSFSNLEIRMLGDNYAHVFGRFDLEREAGHAWGLFTLIFEKNNGSWKVIADHTSSGT